jgi:hypothetical protein
MVLLADAEADENQEKKVSKNTEKVVATLRIKQIENGIRSISSILDTRLLHELDPIERKDLNGAREREKQDKRNNTRRNNNLLFSSSITNQGAIALELLKEKGIEVQATTEEYGDEERIWKHKYQTTSYTQKRKFENPQLHKYYQQLNSEQQKEFKIQCRETLYRLSSDLRKSHSYLKSEMDHRGIFHPAANAHRAHCQYLLKLYKESLTFLLASLSLSDISLSLFSPSVPLSFSPLVSVSSSVRIDASALEDPVLRQMNASRPDSPAIEPYFAHSSGPSVSIQPSSSCSLH